MAKRRKKHGPTRPARVKAPARSLPVLKQAALKALKLAHEHKNALHGRLPAGLIHGLEHDLALLGELIPSVDLAHASSKAATRTQNEALEHAHARISALRQAVHHSTLPDAAKKAWGVGAKLNAKLVKEVEKAAKQIIVRARKAPDEARSAGILPHDVQALEKSLAQVESADAAQEAERASAPATTVERNAAARRVALAVDRIGAAGVNAFPTDATLRGQFQALIGAGARDRSSPPDEPSAAPGSHPPGP